MTDEQQLDQTQSIESPTVETSNDDLKKLREALEKERKQRSALEKQVKAYGSIDPAIAQRAEEILKQQQEWEAAQEKIRQDVANQYKPQLEEYQRKEQAYQQQLTKAQQDLLNFRRDTVLRDEFLNAGGFPGEFEAIAHALQARTRINPETGELEVVDAQGKRAYSSSDPSKPLDVSGLISELKKDQLWFARHFKGFETGGLGLNGTGRNGGNVQGLDGLTPWDRVAKLREMGK